MQLSVQAVVVGVSVHKLTKESQVKFTVDEAKAIREVRQRTATCA